MLENTLIFDDSLSVMKKMDNNKIDLIYLDPPFYTQDIQKLVSRESEEEYSFSDKWNCMKDYLNYMKIRLYECKRILKDTGNMFVHCDRNASHYLKVLLDEIFGIENFQSEIVWCYKRWSNSKKGLLNNHQIILFYSKSSNFKFNKIFTELIKYYKSGLGMKKGNLYINMMKMVKLYWEKAKKEFHYQMYGIFHI